MNSPNSFSSGRWNGGRMALACSCLLNAVLAAALPGARAGEKEVPSATSLHQHDVIPIMLRHCTACHGPRRQEGGLDLRTRASMLRGGKSGPAIVPGNPEQSRIIQKLRAGAMPPEQRLVEASVKPVDATDVERLARWIKLGAPEIAIAPDIAATQPDPLVKDRDRDFWAFRAPQRPAVPRVPSASIRNPVDAFIRQRLITREMSLAPEAERLTLLRRASFDLTGLPPDAGEVHAFLNDQRPDAYERLIDRLLASPRYGERWGRHWLDLAGYADSEGKREQDLPRPHAWRYRDYVIRSFNADKPYDRFLIEQLAGDELADYASAREITPEMADQLVATGFLRMAPDATWANITGYSPDRLEVIADEIDILGSAVMGLTMKCARCHDHKFDPIPIRDYYRLLAVFKGAYDEYDWLKPDVRPGLGPVSQDVSGGRLLPYVASAERREWEASNASIDRAIADLQAALERRTKQLLSQAPAFLDLDVRHLRRLVPSFRSEEEQTTRQVKALEAKRVPEPKIQALWDRGEPSPTYVYRRGDPLLPGRLVGPGVPSLLTDGRTPFEVKPPWPGATSTGRRLALARWLVQPDHPLTARVMVNRLWKQHFGSGLVRTLGDFGRAGARPSHPELLDWLATEFIRQGWSVKAMHRLLMTSETYRQRSDVTPEHQRLDPDNALYSRMPMTRLDAESLYDALLATAGRLDQTPFGPADAVRSRADGLVTPTSTSRGWRRLVYVQQLRKKLATHLETFDFPAMNPNCLERRDSTVAPQALHLWNNAMVLDLAEAFAKRVRAEIGDDPTKQVERVYLIALSRLPNEEERRIGVSALAKFASLSHEQALATYCHAILNSAAFVFVD